jgi:hypothetical protein
MHSGTKLQTHIRGVGDEAMIYLAGYLYYKYTR